MKEKTKKKLIERISRLEAKIQEKENAIAKNRRKIILIKAELRRIDSKKSLKPVIGLKARMEIIAHEHAVYERILTHLPELSLDDLLRFLRLTYKFYSKGKRISISKVALYENIKEYRRKRVGKE